MAHFDWDTGWWDSYERTEYYTVYASVWVMLKDEVANDREAIRAALTESAKKMGRDWRGWTENDFDEYAGLCIDIAFDWSSDVEYFDDDGDEENAHEQREESAREGVHEMMALLTPDGYNYEIDDEIEVI